LAFQCALIGIQLNWVDDQNVNQGNLLTKQEVENNRNVGGILLDTFCLVRGAVAAINIDSYYRLKVMYVMIVLYAFNSFWYD
jgi:hypothetical protein